MRRSVLRRRLLALVGGLVSGLGLLRVQSVQAQAGLMTASGAGVNVKQMPAPGGGDNTVPLREGFAFDAHYAQCIVEDNPSAFMMETHQMGRVNVEPHAFFMAMYGDQVSLVSIKRQEVGALSAQLVGTLQCSTEAGTGSVTVGSRTASEPASFEIEAVDGGEGGGAAGDSFAFTVFFDPDQAPVNYAIFGPKATFTGEMVAGEVTIAPPVVLRAS